MGEVTGLITEQFIHLGGDRYCVQFRKGTSPDLGVWEEKGKENGLKFLGTGVNDDGPVFTFEKEALITDRIDKITKISPEYLGTVLPAPKSVKIELTQRCNYRCSFCALSKRETSNRDLDFDLFKRITTEMRDAGVEEIAPFYIGESFVDPKRLVAAIKWLKEDLETPYVFLTTNGSLANPNVVEECMKAGLNSLKFSVTSGDDKDFENIVRVSPRLFHKALDNIKQARNVRDAGGYRTRLYASSIKYNGEQESAMETLLAVHVIPYVDQHYWLPLYSFADGTGQDTIKMGYKPTPGNTGRIGASRDPLPCWCVFTEGHVCADGMLSACGFDATSRFGMADLNEVSFMDGWNSVAFQKLRKAHLAKDVTGTECENCVLYTG